MTKKTTRTIEYYRLWAGNGSDSGTWDIDFLEIPADTPDDRIEQSVQEEAEKIEWREEPPILVGLYWAGNDCLDIDEEDDDADI